MRLNSMEPQPGVNMALNGTSESNFLLVLSLAVINLKIKSHAYSAACLSHVNVSAIWRLANNR